MLGSTLAFTPRSVAGGDPTLTAPTISPQSGFFLPGQTISVTVTWGVGTGPDYQVWLYSVPTASCIGALGSPGLVSQSGLITITTWTKAFAATSSDTHLCAVVEDYGTGTTLTSGVTSYSIDTPMSSYNTNDENHLPGDSGQPVALTDYPSGGNPPYSFAWYGPSLTPGCPSPSGPVVGTGVSYSPILPTVLVKTAEYYSVMVTDTTIQLTQNQICEDVLVWDHPAFGGSFTIDGLTGTINQQLGEGPLSAVVAFSGGSGPWYAVTIYSGTDSVCSKDTTKVVSLDDINGTQALLTFPAPSAPSSVTYYCAVLADSSSGSPTTSAVLGPIQIDTSPALSAPTFAITPNARDFGQPPVTVKATASWSGGTSPYFVYLVSGSQQNCALDDQPVDPLTPPTTPISLTRTYFVFGPTTLSTVQFTFTSPASSTYYCAVIYDSSIPSSVTESSSDPTTIESLFAVDSPTLSATNVEVTNPMYEGNTVTATVTWSGGSGPYDVSFYAGTVSGASCVGGTLSALSPGFNPLTGVQGASATFSFLAPNVQGAYCYYAIITDVNGNTVGGPAFYSTLVVSPPLGSVTVTLVPTLFPKGPDATDVGQTESVTATVTWTGGSSPYKVTLSDGPSSNCALDTSVVVVTSGSDPQSDLYTSPATFVFTSPPATSYFCAGIADASTPPSIGSSVTGAVWTVNPPPTVTITGPPGFEIAAGTATQITATSVAIGLGPDYFQWFLGPTCNPADAITPTPPAGGLGTYNAGPPPTYSNTYNTGVISTDTTYSVMITDSSYGTPGASICTGDPASTVSANTSQTISTTLSHAIISVGQSVTDSATMEGFANASGTVTYQYFSGSGCSGTPTTVGSPVTVTDSLNPASAPQSFSAPGYYSWNAVYSGDSNNFAATGGCDALIVNTSPMTFALSCNHASVVVGATITCKATVRGPGSSAPTGSVAWSSSGAGLFSGATCNLSKQKASGACSVKFTPTYPGSPSVTIVATYGGDSKNLPSAGTFSLGVTARATKTTVSCTPNSATGLSTVITCTAKVTGYDTSGTVTWTQGGKGLVSFASTSCTIVQGTCSVTMTASTGGHVAITATYAGDPDNRGSSQTAKLTVKA